MIKPTHKPLSLHNLNVKILQTEHHINEAISHRIATIKVQRESVKAVGVNYIAFGLNIAAVSLAVLAGVNGWLHAFLLAVCTYVAYRTALDVIGMHKLLYKTQQMLSDIDRILSKETELLRSLRDERTAREEVSEP